MEKKNNQQTVNSGKKNNIDKQKERQNNLSDNLRKNLLRRKNIKKDSS